MSQLIACATPEGVMLASDSRAETFETSGEEKFVQVERFIPLTSHAVLASAGALEAQDLAREFADFVKDEQLKDIDAIIQAAVPFFTGKVDEFLRKACEKLPLNPVINMYMLLAGYSPQKPDQPGRLFIIWDRVQPPKIESTEATHIFTLPRRMGLEYKLNQLVASRAPLADMIDLAKSAMAKLASQDQYVGPPFRYLTVTQTGITEN
jgi:20S proteasome alpha/beta subunit